MRQSASLRGGACSRVRHSSVGVTVPAPRVFPLAATRHLTFSSVALCPTRCERGIECRASHDEVGDDHRHRVDRDPIHDPEQRGPCLDSPECQRSAEAIGACEHGRREPSDDGEAHLVPTSEYCRRVTQSVRALSHCCNASPLEANSWRIRAASQPTTSSRMGTRTLRALSLMTVLRAIRVMCLASDTAIVKPFPLLTCSITWTSELPSPT